jgi:hypothetical protein
VGAAGSKQRLPARIGVIAGTAVLALALLALIPPNGILSDNEENYCALAARFVAGTPWPRETAVFDAAPHRMLSDATLGALIWLIGYSPTQIVTRLLTVAAYTLVLRELFGVFALSALDAAIVVMGMALVGQDLMGGEWLFGGYEAKVAAYILVLAALRLTLTRERTTAGVLLFALATYFHFLVGGFWFVAAMALRSLDRRHVAAAGALYVLLVAPLFIAIAWFRIADHSAAAATDIPPPDVVYSIIREPHHQSPFLSWPYFRDHWLPGYVMAVPMLMGCIWLTRYAATRRLRVTAVWLAGLLFYLFLVLIPKFLDRDAGVLGKFYLFRPSSLVELLWLMLILAAAADIAGRRTWLLRAMLLATIAPIFCDVQGGRLLREMNTAKAAEDQKALIAKAVQRLTAPDDVVLIDPGVEMQWLDFERRAGRPTWVMWKFAPTNDAELITWYRRIEARQELFDRSCGTDIGIAHPSVLLTTPSAAARLTATCGPVVFRAGPWLLLRKSPL